MKNARYEKKFLPMSRFEMQKAGWQSCDVIFITGDTYIDHPSHEVAVLARLLEQDGLRVGIIAQPNPTRQVDFTQLGTPELFFAVTSGCVDSMFKNYSPTKRPRKYDYYSAGCLPGKCPDHAVVEYSKIIKEEFPETPVVLFGIEASLRRLSHYDYFDDAVKMSVLSESGADMLLYGRAEKAMKELVGTLRRGKNTRECRAIKGLVWRAEYDERIPEIVEDDPIHLPGYDKTRTDKDAFFEMAKADLCNFDPRFAKAMYQRYTDHIIVVNPPQPPLTTDELDELYELPFVRTPHPKYKKQGAIPIFETIKFSITTHLGCTGGCSFCPDYAYQGRYVISRSEQSIMDEVERVSKFRYFRSVISNVGGPVGNVYMAKCKAMENDPEGGTDAQECTRQSCVFPEPCKDLDYDQRPYLELLKKILEVEGVKRAFLPSNLRYDLLESDPYGRQLLELFLTKYTGDNLKIMPMHVSDSVNRRVRKYTTESTNKFFDSIDNILKDLGLDAKKIIPYFIASHPGSTMDDALEVALFTQERGIKKSILQDFIPVPGTASACMYHTGKDPFSDDQMYRPLSHRERKLQRALLHFYEPGNSRFVREALQETGRTDLIGRGPNCLIPPSKEDQDNPTE